MTWTRITDTFNDDPALLEVSRSARLLHVEALVYCNKHLRNGDLPRGALPRITDADDPHLHAKELVEAGVWTETGTGWLLPWDDQEDADEVKARSAYRAATQKKYRERRAKHERDDHTLCDPRYCRSAVTGNATGNKTGNETPSPPHPSRPLGRDRVRAADAATLALRRSALSEQAPRVVFDGSIADGLLTPWDITVHVGDDEGHTTFRLSPPDPLALAEHTDAQVSDGNLWFVGVAAEVYRTLSSDVDRLAGVHRCTGDASCHVDLLGDPDDEPQLEVYVPANLGESWRDLVQRSAIAACNQEANA